MMLRSTSLVPPPTVSAGENRKPRSHSSPSTPLVSSMPCAPMRSLASVNTRLPCGSASALRSDASGPGFLLTAARDHAHAVVAQDLAFDVRVDDLLAAHGVVDAAAVAVVRDEVARARAVAPLQAAAGRERHPLVGQRRLRHAPAEVLLADQVLGRHAHVGEEHFVEAEAAFAGHALDRAHFDARDVHRDDEVRDAGVLRAVGAGARDEDAELGELRERRPDLLAVHDVDVAVALRRASRGSRGRSPRPAR